MNTDSWQLPQQLQPKKKITGRLTEITDRIVRNKPSSSPGELKVELIQAQNI